MPVKPWPEKSERWNWPDDCRGADVETVRPMWAKARYEARAWGDTVTQKDEARSRRISRGGEGTRE